jgi:hypothetical protein
VKGFFPHGPKSVINSQQWAGIPNSDPIDGKPFETHFRRDSVARRSSLVARRSSWPCSGTLEPMRTRTAGVAADAVFGSVVFGEVVMSAMAPRRSALRQRAPLPHGLTGGPATDQVAKF